MNKRSVVWGLLLIACVVAWGLGAAANELGKNGNQLPTLEGTWRLVSRDLPDSTTQTPPAIVGLLTFHDGYRNFNIMWKDKESAKTISISIISTYRLTSSEYAENNVYYMMNNEIEGKGIKYDTSSKSGSSPVKVEDGQFSWRMPLFDEPMITYKGDDLVANGPGFVDHWQRVK